MITLKALENFPRHFALYLWGLLGAVLSDYALITLTIFCVLLGVVTSALIAVTAFFGLYFLMRLVINIADVIGYHANRTGPPVQSIQAPQL